MRKLLLIIIAAIAIIPAALAQTFTESPAKIRSYIPAESTLEWIQLCDYTIEIGGVGASKGVEIEAASMFSTEFLAEHKGKTISAVAIGLYSKLGKTTVQIRKGADVNNAEVVSTKEVQALAGGWNYIKLDTPVEIDGTEPLSIYYKSTDTGNNPMGFDKSKKPAENTSYISMMGQPLANMKQFGSLTVRALIGGDENELANQIILDNAIFRTNVEKGKQAEVMLTLVNCTLNDVTELTLTVDRNGTKTEETLTPPKTFVHNSKTTYTYKSEALTEDTRFAFSITGVNGQENKAEVTETEANITVYEEWQKVDRNILIEKFTGQTCSSCPGGEKKIVEAIAGVEDRVVRIDHHSGYYEDMFTMEGSNSIAEFFGVASAPQCMIDRTWQPERIGTDNEGTVWHPGYMTADMVANEIAKPAFVTIDIENSFNPTTRELNVNVKGKCNVNMSGKKINVILTQSRYIAYQAGVGARYEFNDFPVVFLTDYRGDALQTDGEGNYDMTFKCTVEESYTNSTGTFKVDPSKLQLVAFISDWDGSKTACEVHNAAKADVNEDISIDDTKAEAAITVADGRISVSGQCRELAVYDMAGTQVRNENLKGLYIVKAVTDGKSITRKVVVR